MISYKNIIKTFEDKIELHDNPVVMLHSSYKSIGGVEEGPEGVVDAMLELIGSNGTLLIPTFNFDSWSNSHYYDILETPSQMGVITEIARKKEGFKRTKHPIYSFAVFGKHRDQFLQMSSLSTMGENSVFELFYKLKGLIISIGLEYNDSFTFVHQVEIDSQVSHRRLKDFAGVYLDGDREVTLRKYQMYVRAKKNIQTYVNPIHELLAQEGIIKNFLLGKAKVDYAFTAEYYPACRKHLLDNPTLFYRHG